mmetsp:Transcript_15187/g.30292  ORF Transcript_15187/g.30292 Transcript_15187/m.30292 type:complete len:384 (+) Transcript_15187:176-1327(+)
MNRSWSMLELNDIPKVQNCPDTEKPHVKTATPLGDDSDKILEKKPMKRTSSWSKFNSFFSASKSPKRADSDSLDTTCYGKSTPQTMELFDNGQFLGDAYEEILMNQINSRFPQDDELPCDVDGGNMDRSRLGAKHLPQDAPQSGEGSLPRPEVYEQLLNDQINARFSSSGGSHRPRAVSLGSLISMADDSKEMAPISVNSIPLDRHRNNASDDDEHNFYDTSDTSDSTEETSNDGEDYGETLNEKKAEIEDSSPSGGMKRNVSFGTLQILEFPLILGDNPSCRYGPPTTLAQEHTEEIVLDVEEHEMTKRGNISKRYGGGSLYLPSHTRESLLRMEYGTSEKEIRKVRKEIRSIQRSREWTIRDQKIKVAMDSAGRKLKKWVS